MTFILFAPARVVNIRCFYVFSYNTSILINEWFDIIESMWFAFSNLSSSNSAKNGGMIRLGARPNPYLLISNPNSTSKSLISPPKSSNLHHKILIHLSSCVKYSLLFGTWNNGGRGCIELHCQLPLPQYFSCICITIFSPFI